MKTRDELGRMVRDVWTKWAEFSDPPKLAHLVPWASLDEANREVDRLIGEELFRVGVAESDEARARQALAMLGWEFEAFEAHLDKCSPLAMRRTLELLATDTGDARLEALSRAAEIVMMARLAALAGVSR